MMPRPDPQTRMWRVLRVMKNVSVEDLAILGETTRPQAQALIKRLLRREWVKKVESEVRPRQGRPISKYCLNGTFGPALPRELERRTYERPA